MPKPRLLGALFDQQSCIGWAHGRLRFGEIQVNLLIFRSGSQAVRTKQLEVLKQRLGGAVAPPMKFVHWVCEEVDQRFAGHSVYHAIQDIVRGPRASECHNAVVIGSLERD
jgi:hypothetical protein